MHTHLLGQLLVACVYLRPLSILFHCLSSLHTLHDDVFMQWRFHNKDINDDDDKDGDDVQEASENDDDENQLHHDCVVHDDTVPSHNDAARSDFEPIFACCGSGGHAAGAGVGAVEVVGEM